MPNVGQTDGVLVDCVAVGGTPYGCTALPPDVEPAPDFNFFQSNAFAANGTAPDPLHPMSPYAADITYIMLRRGTHQLLREERVRNSKLPVPAA